MDSKYVCHEWNFRHLIGFVVLKRLLCHGHHYCFLLWILDVHQLHCSIIEILIYFASSSSWLTPSHKSGHAWSATVSHWITLCFLPLAAASTSGSEDLVATQYSHSLIDPISKKRMTSPVRNKLCGHVYDRNSVTSMISAKHKNGFRWELWMHVSILNSLLVFLELWVLALKLLHRII